MNKIYKLIWNASLECWSVASEFARKGRSGCGPQRLILATGLLTVSGVTTANCTPDAKSNIKPETTITCSGENSAPYKISSPDTTLIFEPGSTLRLTGAGKNTGFADVISFNGKNNTQIINHGTLEWQDAKANNGNYSHVAIGVNWSDNDSHPEQGITNASFYNHEDGKVILKTSEQFGYSAMTTGISVNASASDGQANFTNDGVVHVEVPSSDTYTRVAGIALSGKNAIILNNKNVSVDDNILVTSKNNNFSTGIYAYGEGLAHIENKGGINVKSQNTDSTGIILASDKGTLILDNSGSVNAYGTAIHGELYHGGEISINNSGKVNATAERDTSAILLNTPQTNSSLFIANSGKISARSDNGEGSYQGTGISLSLSSQTKGDSGTEHLTSTHIVNTETGEILANGDAIVQQLSSSDDKSFASVFIENSGVIQGERAVNLSSGNDSYTQTAGGATGEIAMGNGDNTVTIKGGTVAGNITGGAGTDIYYQSAGDVVGNLDAGDGDNNITLDGGTLTGDITTGAGNDMIFLSGGKHTGTVSTGKGDDILYLGMYDTSLPDIDITELTRLDGGENSDDEVGDSLIVLRDLTGSTSSEGKSGDVHISGWENIDIGSESVSGINLMARAATESVKTARLSLSGDLDTQSLKINSGSVLNLSGTTESAAVKGNLINAGTIDLTRQSSPSQTLSVTGNYTGSNALLKMNTVWNAPGDALGSNSQSDLLDIAGMASGNTTVIPVSKDGRENVIDGDIRQVNHVINTVPVVKVRTPGEELVFTGTASTTGISEVQLAKRTSNGVDEYFWTATAVETKDEGTPTDSGTPASPVTPSDKGSSGPQIYNSSVAGYVSMPRVNMEQGYSTVATLHERRGENMALAWNVVTPTDGQTWGRLLGEHLKQDGKTRLDVHTDTYGFQFGHDFQVTSYEDGAQRLTGGYVAYTRSDSSFYDRYRAEHGVISGDKYTGKGKSEAWSLGVTDTYYTTGGSYLDLLGQFSYLRNHYESRDNVKVSQNGWSGLLSAEAGHPFILSGADTGPGWLLEPQVQLAYQYVSLQKFSDGVRDVDQNGQSGLRGRVGARLAWNAQKGAERGTGTFYTLANLNHDFVKPGHVDIGRDSVREKYASTWMETGVGMQLPTGPSGYLYTEARYEKELGHTQRDGWQGTFGYKYTWK
ncbi:TPA: autotransporter outer membrane beta-barrel domain-containing protein [Escherichia coli]|nr:autotransporter outer membrane beta-barrel domain-containing protein [Escherichia coli]